MPERCFYGFLTVFLFAVHLSRKRKAVQDRQLHEWNKPSPTAGKPERMILYVRPDTSCRTYKTILSTRWFARFHASGCFPFSFVDFFFTDFSFEVFLSNLPPLPFTSIFASFSEPHQAVISVLGAKVIPGLDGNARSSLLFSAEISSPAGSISAKNLHPLIPAFLSTRNENDRCDRKTHKKMSDKREADKIV